MSRDKQIEEMEQIALMPCNEIMKIVEAKCDEACSCWGCIARLFYAKGYRKSQDVAEEIFAEVEQVMSSLDRRYMVSGNPKQSWGIRGAMTEIAKLKNKYTKSEDTE